MKIRRYQIGIASIYLIVMVAILIFHPVLLNYNIPSTERVLLALLFVTTFLGFYLLSPVLGLRLTKFRVKPLEFFTVTAYGVIVIAIPEEIIFRGIVQGIFLSGVDGVSTKIFFSSLIFGLVHLPNKAKSLYPSGWNWRFATIAFLAGFPLGLSFVMTESLLVPTFLHAILLVSFRLFIKEEGE